MSKPFFVRNDDTMTEVELYGGHKWTFHFANGFGASVIQHRFSYGAGKGLFELAVLRFTSQGWTLCYSTSLTNDVIGNLTEREVDYYLAEIENLNEHGETLEEQESGSREWEHIYGLQFAGC